MPQRMSEELKSKIEECCRVLFTEKHSLAEPREVLEGRIKTLVKPAILWGDVAALEIYPTYDMRGLMWVRIHGEVNTTLIDVLVTRSEQENVFQQDTIQPS